MALLSITASLALVACMPREAAACFIVGLCGTPSGRKFVLNITTTGARIAMPWTTKLLVIANQTIDSDTICDAIIERAAAGPVQVLLVAPASSGAGSRQERRTATGQRLARALERLSDAGVPVEGVVGDPDPMAALQDVWDPRRFDEVIVATLPTGSSRWLAADLPHRVERFTGARVTHIVAAAEHARSQG